MLVPIHQFEIRFTPLIDFARISKEIIGPYVKLTTKFNIEFENTVNQKINLLFEPQGYSIHLYWDRIFLKTSLGFSQLENSTSILNEPFLNILNKLKNLDSFGTVDSFIFYAIVIKIQEKTSFDEIVKEFKSKYFSEHINEIMNDSQDCAVILEKTKNDIIYGSTFGPYKGLEDLKRRNIILVNDDLEYSQPGLMMELKINGSQSDITSRFYKDLVKSANLMVEKL